MATSGVRVIRPDGTEKVYPTGRAIDFDGWGDVIIRDDAGATVAKVDRGLAPEVEVIVDVSTEADAST